MLNSKQQLEENWQYFAIGAVVVILGVVGVIYYLKSANESAQLAATQLSQANMQYRQGNSQVAILTLTDVLAKYGSTGYAEQATFMLGKINLETRNYEEAKHYFEMYLEKYKNDPLNRAAAMSGLGITLENQGKYPEAADKFEKAAAEFPESALLANLHLGAMRNYLMAGLVEKAREHFNIISDKFKGTGMAESAARIFYEKSQPSS
jgi:predicted negative regulator of RcsB-dependent stress response